MRAASPCHFSLALMCVLTGTDARRVGILQRMTSLRPDLRGGRAMFHSGEYGRPLPALCASATFRAGKLIEIKAKQGCRWSDATEERFISGGKMPAPPQSKMPKTSAPLRLAVAVLALLFLVAVGANAAIQTTPDHFAAHSSFAISSPDCPIGEPATGHCQSPTYGTVETYRHSWPLVPTSGSSIGPMQRPRITPPRSICGFSVRLSSSARLPD